MSLHIYITLSLFLSFVLGGGLLLARRRLLLVSRPRDDSRAVQSSHVGNPLRIGGAAVITGLAFVVGLEMVLQEDGIAALLLLSVLPVFIAGLAEDLGHHVSPRGRFLAAMVSAATATALLHAWVPRGDIVGIDSVMAIPAIGIFLTLIFSAGFCHALNLIDGMNGLAASVTSAAALGCAAIAMNASLPEITAFSMLVAAATFGFLLLNWPVARLFLGDAGAYGLGHLIVWPLILIAWYSDEVAVPALMLVIFWPIADVIHTMARRIAARTSIFEPDRMHLHQKVRRMLDLMWFGRNGRRISNPLTTLFLLPFILVPVLAGVVFWNNPNAAWIAFCLFFVVFAATHLLTTHAARKFRR